MAGICDNICEFYHVGPDFLALNILTKSGVKRRRELHLYLNVFMYFKMEKHYIICNKFFYLKKYQTFFLSDIIWNGDFFGIWFSKLYFIHCSTCREKLFFITENIPDGFLTFFFSFFFIFYFFLFPLNKFATFDLVHCLQTCASSF